MGINVMFLEMQAGIAVLILLLMRPGMRKLPGVYSYLLWLVVFGRLLVPVSLESPLGVAPSAAEGRVWLEEHFCRTGMTDGGESAGGMIAGDMGMEGGADARSNENHGNADMAEADSPVNIDSMTENPETGGYGSGNMAAQGADRNAGPVIGDGTGTNFLTAGIKILLILWAAGAAAILAYNRIALILVKRRTARAERLRDNIYVSSHVKSPFTLGTFRPKIYLPPDLSETEQDFIVCHERIHIRRKDYLVKNIAFLLTALHWFNPFVWVAFSYMGRDMEMSCDEKVIGIMGEGIKKQYSQSLLNFARGRCAVAMTPITFGGNSVKQRVSNVLAYRSASRGAAVLGAAIIFMAAGMLFTVRSYGGQDPQGSGVSSAAGPEEKVPVKDSSLAVREVGASPEMVQAAFLAARKSPYGALECWARAFTDRNGDALYQLAADKEGFTQWERVTATGNGSFAFGESSPWPWEYDYEAAMSSEGSAAEITFHMRTSVPEIYLVREKVRITEGEGLYYVDHESTWEDYRIETGQEYEEAYGAGREGSDNSGDGAGGEGSDGYSGYAEMASLYDDAFYRAILAQLLDGDNKGYYQRYTDPVTAARALLHLGPGEGQVTEWHMVPVEQLRSADAELTEWASMPAPDWLLASSASGVGSQVILAYTFAKDGSQVEISMELKEESQGIWGLAGGSIREVYDRVGDPEMIEHEEGKADLTYVLEMSNYGIYRLGAHSGFTCLWVGDVGREAVARISDNRLYIYQSVEQAKENSADGTEVVFVYDLLTGELYRERTGISQNYRKSLPEADLGVKGGFVQVYGFGSQIHTLPLEKVNASLREQKTFRQMIMEVSYV